MAGKAEQGRYYLRSYDRQRSTEKSAIAPTQSDLHTNGFQVYPGGASVTDILLQKLRQHAQGKSRRIFNHNEQDKRDDSKRRQCNCPTKNKDYQVFDRAIREFVAAKVNTSLSPENPVILHSRPGCQPQAAHCDYEPNQHLKACKDSQIPLALVVCLMPNTTLRVWPKSHRLVTGNSECTSIECQKLSLTPGDIVVFRGDLVHAGSEYEQENFRVHYYLDSPLVPREKNRTWLIAKQASPELQQAILPLASSRTEKLANL